MLRRYIAGIVEESLRQLLEQRVEAERPWLERVATYVLCERLGQPGRFALATRILSAAYGCFVDVL